MMVHESEPPLLIFSWDQLHIEGQVVIRKPILDHILLLEGILLNDQWGLDLQKPLQC